MELLYFYLNENTAQSECYAAVKCLLAKGLTLRDLKGTYSCRILLII